MPTNVRSIVRASASNIPRTMLLMSPSSMPAKMLTRNNSRSGNAVEIDQKANPVIWVPLRNTFSVIEVLIILQAMTTKMVLGFFHVTSSDAIFGEYT